MNEGVMATLSGTNSTDPEGGALTYSWCQVSGTPVTLSNPSAAQAASSSVLYIYQSVDAGFQNTDLYLGKTTVSSIPAGGYVDVSLRLTAPYDGSKVYIIAVLDATNALVEYG